MPLYTTPPSTEDLTLLAEEALAAIPAPLAAHASNIRITVEEAADEATLTELGLEHPWELSGLYRGVPMTARSVLDAPALPDTIFLFREAILVEWVETGEDLRLLVSSVLVHEIAHHFGFSDEDIEAVEGED